MFADLKDLRKAALLAVCSNYVSVLHHFENNDTMV